MEDFSRVEEIYHAALETSPEKRAAFVTRSPAWSPDGKRIAFFSDSTGRYEGWLINFDGSGLRKVTNLPDTASSYFRYFQTCSSRFLSQKTTAGSTIQFGDQNPTSGWPQWSDKLEFLVPSL